MAKLGFKANQVQIPQTTCFSKWQLENLTNHICADVNHNTVQYHYISQYHNIVQKHNPLLLHNGEEPIQLLQSRGRITPLGSKLITDIDIIDMEPQMCSGHQNIHQ